MGGETDLAALLETMSPHLNEGSFVFVRADGTAGVEDAVVTVAEPEGLTLVLPRERADELGLPYSFVASWITLQVHSALEAVGLTAAFSAALTSEGISANVVAGYFHDHLFVPEERREDALRALRRLAQPARGTDLTVHDVGTDHGDADDQDADDAQEPPHHGVP